MARDEEMVRYVDESIEKKDRVNRVRQLARCESQKTFDEMVRKEEKVRRQVRLCLVRWRRLGR